MSTITTNTATDPRKGATSASNASADAACPGRHLAQAGLTDSGGEWAESGRKIHAALAGTAGHEFDTINLSLEEREVFDACRSIEQKLVLQYFGDKAPPMRVFREQRYWARFAKDGKQYEHSGQADVVFRAGTKAMIADYKTLAGDLPESPKNMQLRDLGVLVKGNLVPTDEVAVVIIQPFVTHSPTLCVYTKDDLAKAEREMFERVIASNNPLTNRVAGELQCKYCKAKSICVEYQKWAAQIAPPAILSILDVPMASWTADQCGQAASALSPCQKFLDELKDMLKQRLEKDPASVPGWTLEPGKVRETIKDPQGVFDRFVQLGGKIEQFMGCVSVGKAKLKEALNQVTGAKGASLDKAVKTITDGFVESSQTAPSLKRVKETP